MKFREDAFVWLGDKIVWKKGAKLNFPAPFSAEFPHLMSWNFKKIFDTHIFYVIALFFPFVEMQCGSRKWSFHLNWHRFLFPKTHYYCSIYQESDGLKDCCCVICYFQSGAFSQKKNWLINVLYFGVSSVWYFCILFVDFFGQKIQQQVKRVLFCSTFFHLMM